MDIFGRRNMISVEELKRLEADGYRPNGVYVVVKEGKVLVSQSPYEVKDNEYALPQGV